MNTLQPIEKRTRTKQQDIDGLEATHEKNTASLQLVYNDLEKVSSHSRMLEKKLMEQAQLLQQLSSAVANLLTLLNIVSTTQWLRQRSTIILIIS